MMRRTHLVIAVFFILLFLGAVTNKVSFIIVALISSIIPDIDTAHSAVGRSGLFRIFQIFVRHRGLIHSFTLCLTGALLFALFAPLFAFPFFLGYSIHLLADSLTLEGIRPFWPWRKKANWFIRTNSNIEKSIFYSFVMLSILVIIFKYL